MFVIIKCFKKQSIMACFLNKIKAFYDCIFNFLTIIIWNLYAKYFLKNSHEYSMMW
jgi:hypothetical protein